ncbi:MAG: NAD-dependent epimerase/dehydratase family protein [Pseudomonadota bacterium]
MSSPATGSVVLVTGATGFTGGELVRQLVAAGCRVRAIVRASSNRVELDELGVKCVIGDVFDQETIEAACSDVDYVFHVAAAYREAGISDEVYRRVHVTSTQRLAKAVVVSPRLKRFVHVSTVGVHGHIDNPPADETAGFSPGDIYQDTKAEAELWIRRFADTESLPLTVIRPAAIFGPGDMRLLKVFKLAKLPIVPLIGRTKGLYHLIHVNDLCRFMVMACASPEARGQTYICGNVEPTSIREMILTAAEQLGTKPRFMRVPASPVFALARIIEVLAKSLSIEPPIYPRRVAFFTKDRAFETEKMRSLNGFELAFDNRTGVRHTIEWYVSNGML